MNEVSTGAVETRMALDTVNEALRCSNYPAYVGLDVHKDTIAVAVAPVGRGAAQNWGEIANKPKAVAKLVARLSAAFGGEVLAPSLIPRRPGERVKTGTALATGKTRPCGLLRPSGHFAVNKNSVWGFSRLESEYGEQLALVRS